MSSGPHSSTRYRWGFIWAGVVILCASTVAGALWLSEQTLWPAALGSGAMSLFGWGPAVLLLQGLAGLLRALGPAVPGHGLTFSPLIAGALSGWLLGWAVVALGIQSVILAPLPSSEAKGAPLYPPLKAYRDFYWATFFFYGGGILLAELALVALQTLLAGGVHVGTQGKPGKFFDLPAPLAFGVSLSLSAAVAFVAGFFGAARSRRLSAPEATLGFVYFGLPLPILLTAMGFVPSLQMGVGYRLREVLYLANLLGRPELGIWVVFLFLVLMVILGITSGFVATGSGRVDIRAGFELFIAKRHVSVFRPRLLLGILAVLLLGIVPPLVIYAMVKAAAAAVERTRTRALGLSDPLLATAALNEWKSKEQTPTSMMMALSVGGVGVGVMALIVVLSVMSGFEADLQKKILGTNAHIIVMKYSEEFSEYRQAMEKVRSVPGVVGATPIIWNEVMISSEGNISGTVIKGIDPGTVGQVTDLPKNVLPGGSMDYLSHPEDIPPNFEAETTGLAKSKKPATEDQMIQFQKPKSSGPKRAVLPGILLGRELAASLRVSVGDRVNVVSPLGGELGPQGPMPKSQPFRVAGIFYTGMYEYDSKFAYMTLKEAQSFFGVKGATWVEVKVTDVDQARRIAKTIVDKLEGYPYRTKDWGEMNRNLFSALRLEKLVMAIILSIIIIVAAGLIVATVIMLVLEKRKEISVLKALGVPDGGIVKIFLAEGLQIGFAGGLLGLISGLAWCFFIEKVGIKLDPEVYYIPSLPVKVEPLQTALAVLIAILVTYLGSIYPALKASRVEPVEGLKAE